MSVQHSSDCEFSENELDYALHNLVGSKLDVGNTIMTVSENIKHALAQCLQIHPVTFTLSYDELKYNEVHCVSKTEHAYYAS